MDIRNDDLSDIVMTLRYGSFNGENRKKFITSIIVFIVFCMAGMVFGIALVSIQQINEPSSVTSFILALISIIFAFSILPIVLLILLNRNEKIRKELKKCLQDAVRVEALITEIDRRPATLGSIIKFQVDFDIDNIHYTRTSENEKRTFIDIGRPVGYFSEIKVYVDKKVEILYSPKYDEVMILRNT